MSAKKGGPTKRTGRPSSFSQATADAICAGLRAGKSLRAVCREDGMPDKSVVMQWLGGHPDFQDQYAKARAELLEHWADDILEISDDGTNDYVATNDPDNPGYRFNGEHFQRSRLRVDTRKWLLSKLAARKYGDTQTLKHVGSIDTSPQSVEELKAKAEALGINVADLFV